MKSAITVAAIAIATIVNRSGWVASRNVEGLDPVTSLALTAMRRIVAADSGLSAEGSSRTVILNPPVFEDFTNTLVRKYRRNCLKTVVAPGRVELPTFGLGNRCSIHLSYGAVFKDARGLDA